MLLKLSAFLFFFLMVIPSSWAYLSYGDGSETCNWTSDKELDKAIWNCASLTIGTNINITVKNTVTEPIQIRVQGETIIAGDIVVSATAADPGPGGSVGGSCTPNALCDLQDASGSGKGFGGGRGGGLAGIVASGGGGGGAGFSVAGTDGVAGSSGGGLPGALGNGGSSYTSLNLISTTLVGGSGGGAGGSGDDGNGNFGSGGNGGNGSGSIAIISKGNITLTADASISATGISGTDGGSHISGALGGNGGAGSGGAIYLVTAGTLTANAGVTIDISGGAANTNGANPNGGTGSDGIFRVDTSDGTYSGNFGATSPGLTGTTSSSITDPNAPSTDTSGTQELSYDSDISASCSYRTDEKVKIEQLMMSLILGIAISLFLFKGNKLAR